MDDPNARPARPRSAKSGRYASTGHHPRVACLPRQPWVRCGNAISSQLLTLLLSPLGVAELLGHQSLLPMLQPTAAPCRDRDRTTTYSPPRDRLQDHALSTLVLVRTLLTMPHRLPWVGCLRWLIGVAACVGCSRWCRHMVAPVASPLTCPKSSFPSLPNATP